MTKRYAGAKGWPAEFKPWTPANAAENVVLHPDRLEAPFSWRTTRRVFVNSMSDLFHEEIPDEFIDKVFAVMALTPQHTYQVLTKRPERMREYLRESGFRQEMVGIEAELRAGLDRYDAAFKATWPFPLKNVWLGVTVENQRWADHRIPILLDTPAAVRFVSAEPLLQKVELSRWLGGKVGQDFIEDRPGQVALDDQIGHQGGQKLAHVGSAPNGPRANGFPAAPLGSAGVPTDMASHDRVQPVDDLGGGAVDGDPGGRQTTDALPQSEVAFAVEHAGDVTERTWVGRHRNENVVQPRATSPETGASGFQPPLDGGVVGVVLRGECADGQPAPVVGNDLFNGQLDSQHASNFINWVIVGGESGGCHRPFDPAWARSIVAQCADAGVACFVKQLGGARPGNRIEDLPEDLRVREYPA